MTNWRSGEPTPALVVHPPDVASLDEAHAAIEQWEHYSGRTLDDAQALSVEMMMAESASGRWAARSTGRAESRQNGKGDEVEVVEAWGLTQRGEAILHTAHEIPTAKKAHARLVAHLEGHRDLRRLLDGPPRYANGDQNIRTTSGGIIVYRTRTAGGGRGLDDISRLVVDEAQHAQPEQLSSSTPTMAANPNPQTNFTGSAGIAGRSDWWWRMRLRALSPTPGSFSWLEHSAEVLTMGADGIPLSVSPDPEDRAAWRRANPAHPHRVDSGFLEEQLELLGPDLFSREHLCVWDPLPDHGGEGIVLSALVWNARAQVTSQIVDRLAFAVAVSPDAASASIAASGTNAAGLGHVEIIENRAGASWVVDHLAGYIARQHPLSVGVDSSSPAVQQVLPDIQRVCDDAKVHLAKLPTRAYVGACGEFVDAIRERRLVHVDQVWLNNAVAAGRKRIYADAWMWDSRVAADVSPLIAATVARRASSEAKDPVTREPMVAFS